MSKVYVYLAIVSVLSIQALLLGVCSARPQSTQKHERVPRNGAGW